MTKAEKQRLRKNFFRAIGPNAESFKAALELSSDVCMNMKDASGRIMALNRKNCEVCNIRREEDAIGLRSTDLFPPVYAQTYMELDREARESGRPVLEKVTCFPADRSKSVMISNLYPLRNADGRVVGTLHTYKLSRDIRLDADRYQRLRTAYDYLHEHFAEGIRLETLAAISSRSLSSFKREFKSVFGESPGRHLLATRLNAARTLLETTNRNLSDIAFAVGFYDESQFSRLFKRERGLTPGAYRRRNRHFVSK